MNIDVYSDRLSPFDVAAGRRRIQYMELQNTNISVVGNCDVFSTVYITH